MEYSSFPLSVLEARRPCASDAEYSTKVFGSPLVRGHSLVSTLYLIIYILLLLGKVVSMGLPASRMRFIALSATLPNAKDFGSFLGAEVFRFGDEYRPVSLKVRDSSGN